MLDLDMAVATTLSYLTDLAYNLHWTWAPETQRLFARLDPDGWRRFQQDPFALLERADLEGIGHTLQADPLLGEAVARRYDELQAYLGEVPARTPQIAYFSAEFGVGECLPIYSGGLGILAGDYLKAASDLGLPVVGVGLFYHEGYFRQVIDSDGRQRETYPGLDPTLLPLRPAERLGEPVRVAVELPGRMVWIAVWCADVGRVPLYLLDTNLPENRPEDRTITARLYGGDSETRLGQEIVLGIGGVRALTALGISPRIDHMNEGHAAFLALERIRRCARRTGRSFAEARARVRRRLAFTTHTSVPAGIDYFDPALVRAYLAPWCRGLDVDPAEVLALGREDSTDQNAWFSTALLALNTSSRNNAVSVLHQKVASALWSSRATGDGARAPIRAITNGVHNATWVAPEMASLLDRHVGPAWKVHPERADRWRGVRTISDADLWDVRNVLRRHLVDEINERQGSANRLRPDVLTIGFARRFATYKRAALLLRDPLRLGAILADPTHPVQIVFAGKAHPRDERSKDVLQQLSRMAGSRGRGGIVVVEDYDMGLARSLVQGCDVWLNTPLRPREASGTSGMKAALNGALNVSVLDGWWDEAYRPEIGWAIGDRAASWEDSESDARDDADAQAAYATLEQQVAPLFYARDGAGHPRAWLAMVRASLEEISPRFSAARMILEYFHDLYGYTDVSRINHEHVGAFRPPITVSTRE